MHSNNRSKNTKAFAYLNVATITLFFPKHDKCVVRCRYKLFSWFIENLKKNRLKMFKVNIIVEINYNKLSLCFVNSKAGVRQLSERRNG